jgi:hypothetical protein
LNFKKKELFTEKWRKLYEFFSPNASGGTGYDDDDDNVR